MNITPISNNNISHKAYFKNNTQFKEFFCKYPVDENLAFRIVNNLPNHELEILRIKHFEDKSCLLKIFNHTTKRLGEIILSAQEMLQEKQPQWNLYYWLSANADLYKKDERVSTILEYMCKPADEELQYKSGKPIFQSKI